MRTGEGQWIPAVRPGLHAPSLHLRKEASAALGRKELVAMLTERSGLEIGLCSQESGDSFLSPIPNSVFNLQVTLAVTPTNASGSPLS